MYLTTLVPTTVENARAWKTEAEALGVTVVKAWDSLGLLATVSALLESPEEARTLIQLLGLKITSVTTEICITCYAGDMYAVQWMY